MVRVVHLVDPNTTSDALIGLAAIAREGDLVLRLGPVEFPLPLAARIETVHRPLGRTSLTSPGKLWDTDWPILAWSIPCARLAMPIARRAGRPLILSGVDAGTLANQSDLCAQPADGPGLTVCVPTAGDQARLVSQGCSARNVVVALAAWGPRQSSDREAVRSRLGLGPEDWLIVAGDSMGEAEGPRAAVWAFAVLRFLRPHARLVLPLGGAALPAMRRFADQTGFGEDVFIAPPCPEPLDILGAGDTALFCRPTATPSVLASAMRAGLATVAARSATVVELTDDGQAAVLVATGQARDYAAALLELCDQPRRRTELGRRAAELARQRFDSDMVRARLEELCARRAPRGVGPALRGTL